jgi:hypothetical protein
MAAFQNCRMCLPWADVTDLQEMHIELVGHGRTLIGEPSAEIYSAESDSMKVQMIFAEQYQKTEQHSRIGRKRMSTVTCDI